MAASVLGFGVAARAAPVISEIMFHPPGAPEPEAREWLELYNLPGTGSADVSGWRFTKGITFTLPPGTVIGEGGVLVVAANAALGAPFDLAPTLFTSVNSG